MSQAINTWREKLEYLLQQEAILADPAQKFAVSKQIAEARAKVTESGASQADPPPGTPAAFRVDISRIDKYAPAELIGREVETMILAEAWGRAERGEARRPHLLTFVALGGEGKTSLVAKWLADLAHQNWPGCEAAFAWSFYSQGIGEQTASSSDLFLNEALKFFGDPVLAHSPQGAYEKGRRLAQLAGARQSILILDGIEPLQYGPTAPMAGELKDQGLSALLKGLAAKSRGLCVVTTRYAIPDLNNYKQTTAPLVELKRLSTHAGVELLKEMSVKGSEAEYEKLVEDVRGHALTLNLLGTYLRDAHAGDIRKRDLVKLAEADAEEQGGHAFRVLEAYAQVLASEGEMGQRALALLSLLGLFDRPATADSLEALWKASAILGLTEPLVGLTSAPRNFALSRLEAAKLLSVLRDASGTLIALDAHPMVREYFAGRLREGKPEAWRTAHKRLYEHLCATTKEGDAPGLEELLPLYQAVVHGCQAGMQQEASELYDNRILRGRHYTWHCLGAYATELGALASFFDTPWSQISPRLSIVAQAWLMNQVAMCLRSVGRLAEAVDPMRAGQSMAIKDGNLEGAAARASNVSDLELSLGQIEPAIRDAERSIAFSDRTDDEHQRIVSRVALARALHQADESNKALALFSEAEEIQKDYTPHSPLLYGLVGFQYSDLLLEAVERAAWSKTMDFVGHGIDFKTHDLDVLNAVEGRAMQTLKISVSNGWLLPIALDHLTIGRVGLYSKVLGGSDYSNASTAIDTALRGLRGASTLEFTVCGLLTRAWLCQVYGNTQSLETAQADLDEAWEIAERGPMPLYMVDIHLYRARLFFREKHYPWASPQQDLAEARRLIAKHGYRRRKVELEHAEEVVRGETGPEASPLVASAALGVTKDKPTVSPMPITYPTHMKTTSEQSTIILVTVNDHETQALFDAFVGSDGVPAQVTRQGVTYSELGIHGGLRIVNTICEMGAGSVGASQQRTREAIEHWKPKAIIAVGIAFGLDEEKQNLGDVLVSTHIQDYELGRLNANGTLTPRGAKPNSADGLCNRLRQVDSAERRRTNDWPKVRFGVVLSGQKLVDNVDYRNSLKLLFPEAIGGEMEGTGVYVSASAAKVDWIVVKAICDWGHDKNVPDKDARQRSAAANAARVMKAALDIGGLYGEGAVPVATESGVDRNASGVASPVLEIWEKRLAFLLVEEAKLSDPVQKFSLAQHIAEARAKVREYGGRI